MPNPNYEKLVNLMKLANDGVSKKENLAQMGAMLKLIVKLRDDIEKKHTESLQELQKMFEMMFSKLNLAGLEERVNKVLSNVKDGKDGKHGRDGKDADVMEAVTKAMQLMDKEGMKKEHKAEMERMCKEMEMKMEKDMEKMKKDLDMVKSRPAGRMGMRKVPVIKRENLTAQCDGATRSFTLPRDTVAVLGVFGTDFPMTFDSADFTLTGNTLTLSSSFNAPQQGATLFALIEVLFY